MRNNLTIKKWSLAALSFLLMLNMSGCWSYNELNNHSFVVAVGVDKSDEPGKFKVIEQIAMPSGMKSGGGGGKGGSGGGKDAFWNVENEGETMFATIRDNTRKIQRKPFFGHNRVIVFAKDVAEEGILKYLDFIVRDTEPRTTMWMAIARNKASDVLNQEPHLEKIPADKIEKVLEGHKYTSEYHNIQVREFIDEMLSETKASVIPFIEVKEQKSQKENKSSSGGSGEGSSGGSAGSANRVILVNGCAVFKDFKLVGELDNIQGRGYSIVTDNAESGIIVIDSPDGKEKIDIEMNNAKCTVKPKIKGDKVTMSVIVKVEATLAAQESKNNYAKPETLKKLDELLGAAISDEIISSINKAKELKADIFGFGNSIYKKSPKTWKKLKSNWDEEFKNLEVEVNVDARVQGTASISSISGPGGS